MSVNMSSLWELITEITDHTAELIDLVILAVVISVIFMVGAFVVGCITGDAGYTSGKSKGSQHPASDFTGGARLPWMPRR